MGDVPEVEVEFLPSTEAPVGLGEAGYDGGGARDRKRDLRRLGRAGTSSANPVRGRATSTATSELTRQS